MIRADEIHARLGADGWARVLVQLGIPETCLRNKHGPCPACAGKDRFRFDNKRGRGDFYCNVCGAGDGFKLLERVYGWPFTEVRKRVVEAAGMESAASEARFGSLTREPPSSGEQTIAGPTERIHRLRRDRCRIEACDDAVEYLLRSPSVAASSGMYARSACNGRVLARRAPTGPLPRFGGRHSGR